MNLESYRLVKTKYFQFFKLHLAAKLLNSCWDKNEAEVIMPHGEILLIIQIILIPVKSSYYVQDKFYMHSDA